MEGGEPSSGRCKRRKLTRGEIVALTRRTLENIQNQNPRLHLHEGTRCFFFDMTCTGYEWLMPGWVAEERHVKGKREDIERVYRFYYDPLGHFYKSRKLVLQVWEEYGLILIDE